MWSFNEKTGLWEEEGSATLQGNVYVGEVAHFSWVNLDYPEKQGTVYGYVKDDTGKVLPGVRLSIGQLLASTVSKSDGYYSHEVPANTAFSITVKDLYYGGINQKVSVKVPALSPGERRQVDITLPHLVRVYGKVMNERGDGIRSAVWVQTEKVKTEVLQTDKEGNFSVYVPKDMKGKATVYARTYRGEGSKDITIKEEDVYVELTVSETGGGVTTNMIHILSDVLGNEAWPIPTYTSPLSGVVLLDNKLMLIPEEKANILMAIMVAHYDKEKTTYTDGVTASVANRTEKRQFQTMLGKEMKCTVQRNGNDFVFSLEGNGVFYQEASDNDADEEETEEKYDENAKLEGKMMSYPLLIAAKTLRNIKPVDAGFPSITPQLDAKAPLALLITESLNVGKGGAVYYNGGSNDYKTLKNAAAKLGLTNMGEDNDDGCMSVIFYSAKKKILITLDYDPQATGVTDKNTFEDADEYAPISMTILDGISEDTLRAMMEDDDDDDTRSTRVAARKHFNPISKCKFDAFKTKKMFQKLARLR